MSAESKERRIHVCTCLPFILGRFVDKNKKVNRQDHLILKVGVVSRSGCGFTLIRSGSRRVIV